MHVHRVREFLRWFYRYRSIRLTSEGTWFVLLTLGVGVAAINTGHNLLYLLFAMMLSLIIMSGVLSEQCLKQVTIRRRIPAEVFANRPATAVLHIINDKRRFPIFSLRVMDLVGGLAMDRGIHLLHLAPGRSGVYPYPLLLTRRGLYMFEGVKLLTRFPFGLFIKAATLPLPSEVLVYPEIKPLPDSLLHDLCAQGSGRPTPKRGHGPGLYNLRLYRPGDDSRTIHWKTTARETQLVVRETEAEDQQRVTIALHTGMSDPFNATCMTSSDVAFERAVCLTASLVAFFSQQAYEIRLLVGEHEIVYGSGDAHLSRILRVLAQCEPISQASPLRFSEMLDGSMGSGESFVVVLPHADRAAMDSWRGISRIIVASDLLE